MTYQPLELHKARERWAELCREGEAKGLKFNALGYYIARRMTSRQLIVLALQYHRDTTPEATRE